MATSLVPLRNVLNDSFFRLVIYVKLTSRMLFSYYSYQDMFIKQVTPFVFNVSAKFSNGVLF